MCRRAHLAPCACVCVFPGPTTQCGATVSTCVRYKDDTRRTVPYAANIRSVQTGSSVSRAGCRSARPLTRRVRCVQPWRGTAYHVVALRCAEVRVTCVRVCQTGAALVGRRMTNGTRAHATTNTAGRAHGRPEPGNRNRTPCYACPLHAMSGRAAPSRPSGVSLCCQHGNAERQTRERADSRACEAIDAVPRLSTRHQLVGPAAPPLAVRGAI